MSATSATSSACSILSLSSLVGGEGASVDDGCIRCSGTQQTGTNIVWISFFVRYLRQCIHTHFLMCCMPRHLPHPGAGRHVMPD